LAGNSGQRRSKMGRRRPTRRTRALSAFGRASRPQLRIRRARRGAHRTERRAERFGGNTRRDGSHDQASRPRRASTHHRPQRSARGQVKLRARLLLPLLLLAACSARPRHTEAGKAQAAPKADEARLVELDLSAGAPENSDGGALFRTPATQTYTGLVRIIGRAANDDKVRGLFVRLGEASFNLAESEELSRLLAQLRGKNKPVVCHAHALNNSSALLAARGCSKLWLSPAGEVATIGIAAQMLYFHGVLSKLKVDVDFLHMGKFKSGAEPMTREGPSEEARASLVETLAAIRRAWLEESNEIKKSDALEGALEHGPWSPGEALERGLIDEIGFDAEALEAAKKAAKVSAVEVSFGPRAKSGSSMGIGELLRTLSGASSSGDGQPHIAVVPARRDHHGSGRPLAARRDHRPRVGQNPAPHATRRLCQSRRAAHRFARRLPFGQRS